MNIQKFRKPIYCPNASKLGYCKWGAEIGDTVLFDTTYTGEEGELVGARSVGRVIGKSDIDGCGVKQKVPYLAVLTTVSHLSAAHILYVRPEQVCGIYDNKNPDHRHGSTLAWLLTAKELPSADELVRASQYGALSDSSIHKYLVDGKLEFDKVREAERRESARKLGEE